MVAVVIEIARTQAIAHPLDIGMDVFGSNALRREFSIRAKISGGLPRRSFAKPRTVGGIFEGEGKYLNVEELGGETGNCVRVGVIWDN